MAPRPGLLRHRRRLLSGGVKVALGRKDRLDERTRFLGQYLLHLAGLRPIRAVTCRHPEREGAGSQAHMVINAMCFARAAGLEYHHSPFRTISHADRPMPEWAAAWERFFNLGQGEIPCVPTRPGVVNYCYNWADLEEGFGLHRHRDALCAQYKALIPEIAAKYAGETGPRPGTLLIVAVHIRRGDVTPKQRGHFTETEKVVRMLTSLKSVLDDRGADYSIRVYSQGDRDAFAELLPLGAELFLDEDPILTLSELIRADVLVMAKGYYSYYAGLVSDGVKVFEPKEVPLDGERFLPSWAWMSLYPDDTWLPCGPDGAVDPAAFDRQLSHLLQKKQPSVAVPSDPQR